MRTFFFWASLYISSGVILGHLVGRPIALVFIFILLLLRPKREILILTLIGVVGIFTPRYAGNFEILGKNHKDRVEMFTLWRDGWKNVKGGFNARVRGDGNRVYCYGNLEPVMRYPGYSFDGECHAFEIEPNFWERFEKFVKKKSSAFYERFENVSPNVVSMVLSRKSREVYDSGLAHVFAVSGFHISIVFLLFRFIVQNFTYKMFFVETLPLIPSFVFAVSVGLPPSALRAVSMLTLRTIFKLVDYPVHPLNILGLSASLSILFDPFLVYSPSFILSHSATFGVLFGLERKLKWYAIPFIAHIFSLPFALIFFGKIHVLSPFLSLVATPVASIGIVIGVSSFTAFFLGFENIADLMMKGASPIDRLFESFLRFGRASPKVDLEPWVGFFLLGALFIVTRHLKR